MKNQVVHIGRAMPWICWWAKRKPPFGSMGDVCLARTPQSTRQLMGMHTIWALRHLVELTQYVLLDSLSNPNLQWYNRWRWQILSNFLPHFIGQVINSPCWFHVYQYTSKLPREPGTFLILRGNFSLSSLASTLFLIPRIISVSLGSSLFHLLNNVLPALTSDNKTRLLLTV